MAIDAGTLEIRMMMGLARITEDIAKVKNIVGGGMKGVESAVASAKSALGALGIGLGVGAMVAYAKSVLNSAEVLNKMAQKIGVSVEEMSKLKYAADQSDVSLQAMQAGIKKLSQEMIGAGDSTSKSGKLMAALGVDLKQGVNPALEKIAETFRALPDGPTKAALAVQLFGKAGMEMIPFLNQGAEGIRKMKDEAVRLGLVMTQEMTQAAEKFNDSLKTLKFQSDAAAASFLGDMLPGLNRITAAMIEAKRDSGALYAIWVAMGGAAAELIGLNDSEAEKMKGHIRDLKNESEKFASHIDPTRQQALLSGVAHAANMIEGSFVKVNFQLRLSQSYLDAVGGQFEDQVSRMARQGQRLSGPSTPGASEAAIRGVLGTGDDRKKEMEKRASDLAASLKAQQDIMEQAQKLGAAFTLDEEKKLAEEREAIRKGMFDALVKLEEDFAQVQREANEATNDFYKRQGDLMAGVDDFLDPAKAQNFGDALRDSFGAAGSSLAGLTSALKAYGRTEAEIQKQRENAAKILDSGERTKREIALAEKSAEAQIEAFASMAGAAKGFFKEHSAGYKVMEGIEKGFRAVQLALAVQSFVMQIAQIAGLTAATVTGDAAKTASGVGSAGIIAAADSALLMMKIALGIANQANGEPYSAWARMAAMAGVMAGVAAIAGVAFSFGGGGGGASTVAADRQAAQGTGTVLGDAEAKSESILNALEHIRDNSSEELLFQSAMLGALRAIESGIKGMATFVARSGLLTGRGADLHEGAAPATWRTGGNTFSLADSGIIIGNRVGDSSNFTPQTVGQARTNLGANAFNDVERTHTGSFGGIWGNSYTAVNRDIVELERQFKDDISRMVVSMADALGAAVEILTGGRVTAEEVQTILDAINIDVTEISFADLKGDDIQDAIATVFGVIGDNMVTGLIDSIPELEALEAFQQVGEGAFETIIRVASGIEAASAQLGLWGIEMIRWQDIVDKNGNVTTELIRDSIVAAQTVDGVTSSMGLLIQGFDGSTDEIIGLYNKLQELSVLLRASAIDTSHLSQALITAAGGLSALQSGLEAYSEGFFTAAEREAAARSELVTSFERLGLVMPTTRAGFRAMVEAAEAAGDDALLGALLALTPAFADLVPAIEDTVEAVKEAVRELTVGDYGIAGASGAQARIDALSRVFSGSGSFSDRSSAMLGALGGEIERTQLDINQWIAEFGERNSQGQTWGGLVAWREMIEQFKKQMGEVQGDLGQFWEFEAIAPGHGEALLQLQQWYDTQKAIVGGNQAALLALEKMYGEKRTDILTSGLNDQMGGLRDYIDKLLVDPSLSPLSKMQQLGETRSQFEKLLGAAQGGDASASGKLQGASDAYLRIAREIYKSGPQYNEIFRDVLSGIGGVAGVMDTDARLAQALPTSGQLATGADIAGVTEALMELTTMLAERGIETRDPEVSDRVKILTDTVTTKQRGGLLV